MRNSLSALCALLLLLGAGTAHGSTVYTGLGFDIQVSTPTPVGTGGNLYSIWLEAIGKTVEYPALSGMFHTFLPSGFDGMTGGLTGITTTGDELHQVFKFAVFGQETPTFVNQVATSVDTHFLLAPPSFAVADSLDAPTENQVVADATEHAFAGYGNYLTGRFALSSGVDAAWGFAQLVVPSGTTVNLDFRIADGGGAFPFELVDESFTVVPEPASIWLLAIGVLAPALAFLARRRRARRI